MPFPIRAVSFDLVGTILFPAEPVERTYARKARSFGIAAEERAVRLRLAAAMRKAPPFVPGKNEDEAAAAKRWWQPIVFAALGRPKDADAFEATFEALFSHYAKASAWRVHPSLPAMLARLRARGLALAVCSNADSRLVRVLKALGLRDMFDFVLLPAEAGAAKPDAAMFAALARRFGMRPEAVLHLGNDRREDEQAPPMAGVHGRLWHLAPEDDADAAWARLEGLIEEASLCWPWTDPEAWRKAAACRPDGVDEAEQRRRREHAERFNRAHGITDPAQLADQELYIRGKMTLDEYEAYLALRHWPQTKG